MTEQELKDTQDKLKLMEKDLEIKAKEIDAREEKLQIQEQELSEREQKLMKTLGIVDASNSFKEMVSTVDNIYNLYCGIRGTDEGLIESLQKMLDARKSFNK